MLQLAAASRGRALECFIRGSVARFGFRSRSCELNPNLELLGLCQEFPLYQRLY